MSIFLEKNNSILTIENGPTFKRDENGRFIVDVAELQKEGYFDVSLDTYRRSKYNILDKYQDDRMIFKIDSMTGESDAELYYSSMVSLSSGHIVANEVYPAVNDSGKVGILVKHFNDDPSVMREVTVLDMFKSRKNKRTCNYAETYSNVEDVVWEVENFTNNLDKSYGVDEFVLENDFKLKLLQMVIADYATAFTDRRITNISTLFKRDANKCRVELAPLYDNGFMMGFSSNIVQVGFNAALQAIGDLAQNCSNRFTKKKYKDLITVMGNDVLGISETAASSESAQIPFKKYERFESQLADEIANSSENYAFFKEFVSIKYNQVEELNKEVNPGYQFMDALKNADAILSTKEIRMDGLLETNRDSREA